MSEPQTPQGGHPPSAPDAGTAPASDAGTAPTSDAAAAPVSDEGTHGSGPPSARHTGRGRRVLLIVVLALVGVLGAATATGLYLYDKATEPDRSTPVVSADAFLHAALIEGDEGRVGLYTCSTWSPRDALASVRSMVDSEARVSWDSFAVIEQTGDRARVTARMRFRYEGELAPSGERQLTLTLALDDGWRVCGAERPLTQPIAGRPGSPR